MKVNWDKAVAIAGLAIAFVAMLAAVTSAVVPQAEVRAWLAQLATHVSLYAVGQVLLDLASVTLAVISVVLARRALGHQTAALGVAKSAVAAAEAMITITERRHDPVKDTTIRLDRADTTTSSPKRGKIDVELAYDSRYDRPLTFHGIALEYWRFDSMQMPAVVPIAQGIGNPLNRHDAIRFELPLREEEIKDMLTALRLLQQMRGIDIDGFFAHGVTTMHRIQVNGAVLLRDDGKDVRIPIALDFDRASLTITGITNPWPTKKGDP
jgi:hypothetical protein